jgi:hypothetical protein
VRLWSLHPQYLDRQALVACWREALLAQAVLAGRTRGYRHHPQLRRLAAQPDPVASVAAYLQALAAEADRRGYRFDRTRIDVVPADRASVPRVPVTDGQLAYEWQHLLTKVGARNPHLLEGLTAVASPEPHPLFTVVAGDMEEWEVTSG